MKYIRTTTYWQRRFKAWTIHLMAFSVICLSFSSPAMAGNFPPRPSNVTLQTVSGVIVHYSVGNDLGYFEIKNGSGKTTVGIGASIKINGVLVYCDDPSYPHAKCTDWPPAIVLNQTVVVATCWTYTRNGVTFLMSDQIDTK
jgi:hypothetical protein